MKTYIRKNITGYYVEFPEEIDAQYWEGKIGTTYEDFLAGKWIPLSDEQVVFHNEHPDYSVKNVIEMQDPETIEKTLEQVKAEKIIQINSYDNSIDVNSFYFVDESGSHIPVWFTPNERSNYRSSIEAAELVGVENLSLYIGENLVTIPTATAKLMLAQIQLYADQCFIVTKQHKAIIEEAESIEYIDNYDITQGYPEKLIFEL